MKNVLLVIVGGLAATAVGGVCSAFAIETMWNWFAVGALDLPALSLGNAYGLFLLVCLFQTPPPIPATTGADSPNPYVAAFVGRALGLILTLTIGWCVHGGLR
jgi:hypothetical protein